MRNSPRRRDNRPFFRVLRLQVSPRKKISSHAGLGPIKDGLGLFRTVTGMNFEAIIRLLGVAILADDGYHAECPERSFEAFRAAAKAK